MLPTHPARTSRARRRRAYRQLLDALEPRTLLSASLTFAGGANPDSFSASSQVRVGSQIYAANYGANGGEIDIVSADASNNISVTPAISVPDMLPLSLTYDATNNKLYFIDLFTNDIVQVDPANPSAAPVVFTLPTYDSPTWGALNSAPAAIAVTDDGAVWAICGNNYTYPPDNSSFTATDLIARLDPVANTTNFFVINDVEDVSNSGLNFITAHGDSAYVSMDGAGIVNNYFGQSRIAVASYDSGAGAITMTPGNIYNLDTGVAADDAYGLLSPVAFDSSGQAWFTVSGSATTPTPVQVGDLVVHGLSTQSAVAVPNPTDALTQGTTQPVFDSANRLWFIQTDVNSVGFLDTTASDLSSGFTTIPAPDGPGGATTGISGIVPTTDGSSAYAFATDFDNSGNFTGGYSVMKFDTQTSGTTPFTIQAGFQQTLQDGVDYSHLLLATFTAPAGGDYQATVHLGNGAGKIVVDATPSAADPTTFYVYLDVSAFKLAGAYTGKIVIKEDGTKLGPKVEFTTTVTDTPLNVTSFALVSVVNKTVTVSATFTDDDTAKAGWYNVTFSWNGGADTKNAQITEVSPGVFVATASFKIKTAGTYHIGMSITTSEVGAVLGNVTPPAVTVVVS